MIQHLDKTNFDATINTNDVVLVDFFADWCGPCKALHPALEELAKDFDGRAVISKINVDTNPELAAQFKVRSIPALFYFKNGEIVGTQNGVQSKSVMTSHLTSLIKS
ncbi:thioredoxin [Flavobacterium sp. K5-23]|uniref:thioredoxin n=1 Tax=Flavobacterium sp. K5-23 TaxID=2746225 RepID=UPI00200BC7C7|nr:thioredoxin [Flavobacterium sp. K5-23]UQD55286.1 thioredoxin [Flavobacterium sp. K5-23]